VRGVLLDIEGTTTPIRFVYDVLFPFARAHAGTFLNMGANNPEIQDVVEALHREHGVDAGRDPDVPPWTGPEAALTYTHWLMDRDRKSTALKRLQGLIWKEGYREGTLRGEVFPDVAPALERWSRNGVDTRIFSSGSVLAQKLIFSTTPVGDLTRFLKGYFDTETGPKTEAPSYARIAKEFGLEPREIVFVSDVTRELDAAHAAGMQTALAVRPGNPPQAQGLHRVISSFDELG
jgi:enolase-phosphatase E1